MDLTPNYGLGKPLEGENYDIDVPNTNMDILDGQLQAVANRVDVVEQKLPTGVTPSAKVSTAANQVVSNNAIENVDLAGGAGTETLAGMLGIATDRLTIKRAGYYIISFRAVWDANATGRRYSVINKGNPTAAAVADDSRIAAGANTMPMILHTPPILCAVDDWFFAQVLQSSGGALNLMAGSSIQATWVAGV